MSAVDWLQWLLLPVIAGAAFIATRAFFRASVDRLRADRDQRLRRTLKAMQQLLDEKPEEALRSVMGLVAPERGPAGRDDAVSADVDDTAWLQGFRREALDRETFEMHIIIGRLLRRQGDFERAIGVHEALLGAETLDERQRGAVRIELARDFMAAGVYDRAETTLRSMLEDPEHGRDAHRMLLSILEMQREWAQAERVVEAMIAASTTGQPPVWAGSARTPREAPADDTATMDGGEAASAEPTPALASDADSTHTPTHRAPDDTQVTGSSRRSAAKWSAGDRDRNWLTALRAHYLLEQATERLDRGRIDDARELTERAARIAPGLARTELMRADCAARAGAYDVAIGHAKAAVQAQPSLAALGIARIERFARRLSGHAAASGGAAPGMSSEALVIDALRDLQRLHPSPFGAVALTRALRRASRLDEALGALREVLAMRPVPISGLLEAVRWMKVLPSSQPYFGDFEAFERALADQLARQPLYQCAHCGFEGRQHVWHCPSCRRWDSFRALDIDPDATEWRSEARSDGQPWPSSVPAVGAGRSPVSLADRDGGPRATSPG